MVALTFPNRSASINENVNIFSNTRSTENSAIQNLPFGLKSSRIAAHSSHPMNTQEIKEAFDAGHRVYGTAVLTASPFWPPYLSQTGIDFVFIDTEHVPLDRNSLSWMCRTYSALSLAPIVRIPNHDPNEACKALDGGAQGIIAPYIEHPDQLKPLVGATKYRPIKGERLDKILNHSSPVEPELEAYLDDRNQNTLLIANIESQPAIQNLDKILEIQELDAVLIGPHDLSCSLGIPEDYNHPRFDEAVEQIFRQARAAGKGAGLHFVHGVDRHVELAKLGANFIIHSDCIHLITEKLTEDLKQLRHAFGDSSRPTSNPTEKIPVI